MVFDVCSPQDPLPIFTEWQCWRCSGRGPKFRIMHGIVEALKLNKDDVFVKKKKKNYERLPHLTYKFLLIHCLTS